jgi:hypothetical protein
MTKKLTILTLTFLLVFLSCEKDVFLNLADREGAYMIVEADIADDGRRQWVRLSWSTSYYDQNRGKPITGAKIQIRADENMIFNFSEFATDTLEGYYFNKKISSQVRGRQLKLTIENEGLTYTAQSRWKPLPGIDSVTLRLNTFSRLGFLPDTLYDVVVHFPEPAQRENFYLFNLYVNDTLKTVRPRSKGLLSDRNLENYVSLSVLNISKSDIREGDILTLEMRSISEEYFNFYTIFFFQTDLSGNPFAGAPPANIPTNLSQGARGFFQVSAIERKSIIYVPVIW